MTFNAIVEMTLQPGAAPKAPAILHEVLSDTRKFPGCRNVDVLFDDADPQHVFVIETWESADADAAYREWRATPEGTPSIMGEILAGEPKVFTGSFAEDV